MLDLNADSLGRLLRHRKDSEVNTAAAEVTSPPGAAEPQSWRESRDRFRQKLRERQEAAPPASKDGQALRAEAAAPPAPAKPESWHEGRERSRQKAEEQREAAQLRAKERRTPPAKANATTGRPPSERLRFKTAVKSLRNKPQIPIQMQRSRAVRDPMAEYLVAHPDTEARVVIELARYGHPVGLDELFARLGTCGLEFDSTEQVRAVLVAALAPNQLKGSQWSMNPTQLKSCLEAMRQRRIAGAAARAQLSETGSEGPMPAVRHDQAAIEATASAATTASRVPVGIYQSAQSVATTPLSKLYKANRTKGVLSRFSDWNGIKMGDDDDWFDSIASVDTQLFIDPYLVFNDTDPFWAGCDDLVAQFFQNVSVLIAEAHGMTVSPEVIGLLQFPEPNEFSLGLSIGNPKGSGIGAILANEIADRLRPARDLIARGKFTRPEVVGLLCANIGPDRISDMFCNIVKSRFIAYTSAIAARHKIQTVRVNVTHAAFTPTHWVNKRVDLPVSQHMGTPVLLVPRRFLSVIRPVTVEGFYDWSLWNQGSALRDWLSAHLRVRLDERSRMEPSTRVKAARGLAQARPELALEYVESTNAGRQPYHMGKDYLRLVT